MKKIILSSALLFLATGLTFSQTKENSSNSTPAKTEVKKEEVKQAPVKQAVKPVQSKQTTITPAKGETKKVEQASPTNRVTPATNVKKDGTPDRRYKENKNLKKDGTPDMRYKENKEKAVSPEKSSK